MTREARRRIVISAHLLLMAFVFLPSVCAQDAQPSPTPLMAPPPFKMIVKEERSQIEANTREPSKRLKLTIDFAAAHLTVAEQHTGCAVLPVHGLRQELDTYHQHAAVHAGLDELVGY